MRKKIILRLFLIIAFATSMYSCIHDEVSSASEMQNQEYTSKSLWQEDEKYIKNVKAVFDEYANKSYFTANFGTVNWDYALTMGTFDESFLEAPVIKDGKVSFVLVAYREGDRVFFKRKEDRSSNEFFNTLVFKKRNQLSGKVVDTPSQNSKGLLCYTAEITWTWTNDDGSAGETFVYNETRCKSTGPYLPCQSVEVNDNCGGSTAGGAPGSGSGGGGSGSGYPYPQESNNPCERTQNMLVKAGVQPKIDELKTQSTLGGEKGVKFKSDGTPSPTISGGAHSVNFGDKTGYAGGYHNHTPTGIPMLSPPDVDQLLGFARAQPTSNPLNVNNAFVGMVAPNGMHYVIWFNGTYQDALTNFSQEQLNKYIDKYQQRESELTDEVISGKMYMNSDGSINNLGVEKLFFETLKNMGLEGKVNLQRVESDGTVKVIGLNSSSQPVSTTCS